MCCVDTDLSALIANDWPQFIACVSNVYTNAYTQLANFFIVAEMNIILRNIDNFANATALFLAMHYCMHIASQAAR